MGRVRSHSGAKEKEELTQFKMRLCAVQNKSRPCCVEDDEESEMRAY